MTTLPGQLRAEDMMQRRVHTVTADMNLADVIASLVKHRVSNVPVVEETPAALKLVGFISERDCLEHLSNEIFYGFPSPPQTAGTIMKRHPVCVSPDTDLFTLASILTHHGLRHLPVVCNDELLGIVSRSDVLRGLDDYYRRSLGLKDEERRPLDLHQIINHRFIASG